MKGILLLPILFLFQPSALAEEMDGSISRKIDSHIKQANQAKKADDVSSLCDQIRGAWELTFFNKDRLNKYDSSRNWNSLFTTLTAKYKEYECLRYAGVLPFDPLEIISQSPSTRSDNKISKNKKASTLSYGSTAKTEIDPKTHKMCLQAQDYKGCVDAQSVNSNKEGNSCPDGYAFIGGGYCREVTCSYKGLAGGKNEPLLGGKKWKCGPVGTLIKERTSLTFGPTLRIGNNSDCPSGLPEKGWTSTCDAPYKEPPKEERVFGRANRSGGGGGGGGGGVYKSSGPQPKNYQNWQPQNNTAKPFSHYQNKYNNQIKTTNPYGNGIHKNWGTIP